MGASQSIQQSSQQRRPADTGASTAAPAAAPSGVYIDALATVYPEPVVDNAFLDKVLPTVAAGFEEQAAKLRTISKRTGIKSRPVVLAQDDPFYHAAEPYQLEQLTDIWLKHGIPLSTRACLDALADWGGDVSEITHLVAATCSVQCHPGIDAYIAHELKLPPTVSRTLLTGVGCAGAAALLKTAYELADAATFRQKPARILIIACDLNSLGFRSELEQLKHGRFPIGLTLFSDAAAAAVISNGVAPAGSSKEGSHRSFEILDWMNYTIPDTLEELKLMPTSIGPISSISKKLPELIPPAVQDLFKQVISSMPPLIGSDGRKYSQPSDFDWDVHPGGLGIFDKIIQVMGLTRDNTTATVTTYESYGNSAGPTVLKVLGVRRELPIQREFIVCCGFGNNVDITMLILKRCH